MDLSSLESVAEKLVAKGKGILAADESSGTIKKRFDKIRVDSTPENHRIYRQLLFTTPKIEKYISGVILFDETIRQSSDDAVPFPKLLTGRGIIPGIKVDQGKVDMPDCPGEKLTQGLDGLPERLAEYRELGARFTKWRTVVPISDDTPSDAGLEANSETQAKFAKFSQEAGLVPIVEPEVLIDGDHDIKKAREVGYRTLNTVFKKLSEYEVKFSGMLLKASMVTPGKNSRKKMGPEEIAKQTLRCFGEVVPSEVPGVVFLSGGQTPEQATENLNEINRMGGVPWELSFSFGRALQEPALAAWKGRKDNIGVAQREFLKRAKFNSLARSGSYTSEMEKEYGEYKSSLEDD